ncbi:exported protein of unknown function [Hyphomicrobium sp. MC1]|nr:exported protein of unknown function [Hyphomicrobium sp. MC1]
MVKAKAALSIFVFNILVNAFGATAITPG